MIIYLLSAFHGLQYYFSANAPERYALNLIFQQMQLSHGFNQKLFILRPE
jgi:hypothetical protein